MITPEYCQVMAQYGAWQNRQIFDALDGQPLKVLTEDRGAFFKSILGTLNHLYWGDQIWMSRFDPSVEAPKVSTPDSPDIFPTLGAWSAARFHLDGKIQHWANALRALDLTGELQWFYRGGQRDMTQPLAVCVTHMFNHQTHHRGQIHAMLTAAGFNAPVSDLALMPEEG